jgi:hypothetical protein
LGKNAEVSVRTKTEGSLQVTLPTYGQMQQQWWEQSEKRRVRRERVRRERGRRERVSRKKVKVCEKVERS